MLRYVPPTGFGFDILTRLGEACAFDDLVIEEKTYAGVRVRVVSPRALWPMKKDTVRPIDRFDAVALAAGSEARSAEMTVQRYRSIEDMPPPWREPDDPANLRETARMLRLYRSLAGDPPPGVRRFRTIEDANAERGDLDRR